MDISRELNKGFEGWSSKRVCFYLHKELYNLLHEKKSSLLKIIPISFDKILNAVIFFGLRKYADFMKGIWKALEEIMGLKFEEILKKRISLLDYDEKLKESYDLVYYNAFMEILEILEKEHQIKKEVKKEFLEEYYEDPEKFFKIYEGLSDLHDQLDKKKDKKL